MPDATLSSMLPTIDLGPYLASRAAPSGLARSGCGELAQALIGYGAVVIRDARVTAGDADEFLDLLERYFSQPASAKLADARPEASYQVGVTPAFVERARDHYATVRRLDVGERPRGRAAAAAAAGEVAGGDPKWRFLWRVGARPSTTAFPELHLPPVVPGGFPRWAEVMDRWGGKLLSALFAAAEMLALGLGLPRGAIRDKMERGPHLLAPTGSDLGRYGKRELIDTALAAFHYDLNALTIHGKSRFPGLYIWTREGKRLECKVPRGCLLVQAGAQIEHLTGGIIRRGFHEVVVSEATVAATEAARSRGAPLWRVSSTLFGHVRSDESLMPLMGDTRSGAYGDIKAGEQVAAELKAINLAA